MINFKGLFSSETSAIGLTSLGMPRKKHNQNSSKQSLQTEKDLSTRLQESKTLFSAKTAKTTTQSKIQVQAQQPTEMRPLTPLFSNKNTLNLNNNSLLG